MYILNNQREKAAGNNEANNEHYVLPPYYCIWRGVLNDGN